MNRRQWIKYFVFIWVFLLFVFVLNDYRIGECDFIPVRVACVEKDAILLEMPEKEAVVPVPQRVIVIEKPAPEREEAPVERLPAAVPELEVEMLTLHLDSIGDEMKLLVSENIADLPVRRFHIPPVKYEMNPKDLILPALMITAGAIASQTKDYRDFIHIPRPDGKIEQHRYDDVLQYVVPGSLFVYDAIGKEKHHPVDQFFVMSVSYGLTALQVRNLKSYLDEPRPDGGGHSFPSGHTAVAFVGAHMIYKEFKDSNLWIASSGYLMAGVVGAGRIINNRHWLSDVVAGAGIAILSTELAYLIYFPVRNLITNEANKILGNYFVVGPILRPDAVGLQLNLTF